jgi:hypothetical protein
MRLAQDLVDTRKAEWNGYALFTMADGRETKAPMLIIYEMQIGRHLVRNVRAAAINSDDMLLGFDAVDKIGSFTINTRSGELVFTSEPSRAAAAPKTNQDYWPEGTNVSGKCAEQVLQHLDLTPDCKANLDSWGAQLNKNLNDPAFKKRLIDMFDRQ